MANTNKPLGEIVLIGSAAYQLYSDTFRGRVQYYAKVGKPLLDRKTGEASVLPWMTDNATRDFLAAAEQAAEELEQLRNAAFRQDVQRTATSITPVSAADEDDLELVVDNAPASKVA